MELQPDWKIAFVGSGVSDDEAQLFAETSECHFWLRRDDLMEPNEVLDLRVDEAQARGWISSDAKIEIIE